jgi:lysozyme family protein
MPSVNFTGNLQRHYAELYASCELSERRFDQVDTLCRQVLADRSRYERVAAETGVPWFLVAAIHVLEAGRRFDRHLHNGDSLRARTRRVPAGRPLSGEPPFTWEESARDALAMHRLDKVREWTLPRILYELEKYNGWGYRLYHPHVCTPYLWGFSSHYTSGKYIADGTWSDTAVSRQCGAAVLIRRLEELGEITPLTRNGQRGRCFTMRITPSSAVRTCSGFSIPLTASPCGWMAGRASVHRTRLKKCSAAASVGIRDPDRVEPLAGTARSQEWQARPVMRAVLGAVA